MRSNRSLAASAALLSALTVLAGACTETTDPTPIASILLLPSVDSIEVGQTFSSWSVTLKDAAGKDLGVRPLAWESSRPEVASIDASTGTVTALGGPSDVIITVRAEGKSAQATFRTLTPILTIVATPDSFDLPLTTTRNIVVSLVGPNGVAITNRTVTWASLNPSVAVVSATGIVTSVGVGTTTITIKAGTKQANVRVRVVGEPVASVRITPAGSVHVIRLGQSKQLTAECLSASQQVLTGRTISWNANNPVVASVSTNGLVTGNALGSGNITATCENASNTVTAQVTQVPVTSVSISPTSLSLSQSSSAQLTATARDSANNVLSLQGRTVVWSSSNIPVANVSNQGVVQSTQQIGTANITVSVDGITSAPVTVDVHAFFSALTTPASTVLPAAGFYRPNATELPER